MGSGERAGIPTSTSRIRRPCLWEKVDFGSRLLERGRPQERPRGFWGLTPADPGTCTAAAPEGRTSPCPGSAAGALSPTRVGGRHAAATRAERGSGDARPDGVVGGGRAAAGCTECRSCRPAAEPRFVPGGSAEHGVRVCLPEPPVPFPRVSEHACVPLPARARWALGGFFSFLPPPLLASSPPPRLLQVLLLVACKGFAPPF